MKEGKIYEGDILIMEVFQEAILDDGRKVCEACLFELITENIKNPRAPVVSYKESKVKLNTIYSGDEKQYKIHVVDPRDNKVRKIEFGNSIVKPNGNGKVRKFKTIHKCRPPNSAWSCLG